MAIDRRELMRLAGLGGVVFASGLPGRAHAQADAGAPTFVTRSSK